MSFCIALSGAQGVGKTTIVQELASRLKSRGASVSVIESPTRYVKSLGFGINKDGDWRTQLFSVVHRVTRQIEAKNKADFILSDRCLLDEMVYTENHITTLYSQDLSLDKNKNLLVRFEQVQAQTYDLFIRDLNGFWDVVYYKPPHPDFPPVGDGDRSTDLKYQLEIDQCFLDMRLGYLKERIPTLPCDIKESVEEIYALEGVQKILEDNLWGNV